jgi:transcriptional regulator with XRE-family HTH domain
MVGKSEDWLSKIERGERQAQRLDVLTDLARELRVTLGDLLGEPVLAEDIDKHADDNVPAVRDALMAPRRLSRVLFCIVSGIAACRRRVNRADGISARSASLNHTG